LRRANACFCQYLLDNAGAETAQRFTSLEVLYDPATICHLQARGIGSGWRCLEIGGGSGSIAAWMARQVGPTGQVLVSDIDPRHVGAVAALGYPQLTIQQHDVTSDPLPEQAYDLIHSRLALMHVRMPEQALPKLVAALKPGGWLVVEDPDFRLIDRTFSTQDKAAGALFQKGMAAQLQLMEKRGADLDWGHQLYTHVHAQGLEDVGMEGHLTIWRGGSDGSRLMRANFEQLREEAVAHGLVSELEIGQTLALLNDPTFVISSHVMMAARGRRPVERRRLPHCAVERDLEV
jgi:2-polyprenyl-3-methyl-5-hydroxy-6-metoxy-1,4-benzoquinol methylase